MGFIYVVKLHDNKRYIYFTTDSDFQFWELDKDISEFVYYYGALEVDIIIPNCDKYDTDKYVKKYMKYYGLDSVRGGSYNNLKLTCFEKEFIQKEFDYIDIDDDKYNNKNKKKIEWIEYYKDQLRQIKTNGYWVLIKPEENPNSRLPKFLLDKVYSKYYQPPHISDESNIENIEWMINDDCVDSFRGPIQYNSDYSIKNYRVLVKFTYSDGYYEYRYKFYKNCEYNIDDSTFDDIKSKEQDIKYKLFMLENNCNI